MIIFILILILLAILWPHFSRGVLIGLKNLALFLFVVGYFAYGYLEVMDRQRAEDTSTGATISTPVNNAAGTAAPQLTTEEAEKFQLKLNQEARSVEACLEDRLYADGWASYGYDKASNVFWEIATACCNKLSPPSPEPYGCGKQNYAIGVSVVRADKYIRSHH